MHGLFFGALVIAGLFAFMPGASCTRSTSAAEAEH
jgi:uncharacterized membrane protein